MSPSRRSREFALAAACCRWPPTPQRDDAVAAAADAVLDWGGFAAIAARHRIEGLAHDALRRAAFRAPSRVADGLAVRAAQIARQGLVLAAESARLQMILDDAAIPNLVLKGASLDVLAYGAIGLKSAWDIDLLVTPSLAVAARRVLEADGYDLVDPGDLSDADFNQWIILSKECVFVHRQSRVVAELHWRLVDGALLPGLSAMSPFQVVKIAPAVGLRTFATGELFAYLSVHGAAHGWSRLKWLADVAALLAREDEAGREHFYRDAVLRGAGTCPAVALRLCQRLLGLALPPWLTAELHGDVKTRWLEAVAMDAMTGGGAQEIAERPFASERILVSHILFAGGWRYRWGEFRRQWISLSDRRRVRLPMTLGFVYSLIRLPLFVWRRAVRGLARRARSA